MASGNAREYVVKIDLTLADSDTNPTVLHLTEADIWNDTFSIETASSGTSSFDIGTAVIGQCKFSLNNFDERFNQYDFFNATATVWVGLAGDEDNGQQIYYPMGVFTVDEPTFAGALIQLICLDNMWKFDVPLSEVNITFPTTAQLAVNAICNYCGVTLNTQEFHGYNFTISESPQNDINCREFLQYVAMIGCNFCVINYAGALDIRWYETTSVPVGADIDGGSYWTTTTPYSDGDTADGGNFIDYTSGDDLDGGNFTDFSKVDDFTRNIQTSFCTDILTVTGVKFILDKTEYKIGTDGYVLTLENPLVNENNVSDVLNLIWDVLEGFTFRPFNVQTLANLAVEVGDCCVINDYKGNLVYSYVTINSFRVGNHTVQCNAIPPTRTLVKRYSKTVQTAVDISRKVTDEKISNYDVLVQELNRLSSEAMGAFTNYEDAPTGGRYYYTSNMPITKNPETGICSFEPNSVVFKLAGDVLSVSRDGGITWVNGYDPTTGTLLVNVLDAIGINCDWIRSGTLTLGGINNTNGRIIMKDADDKTIGTWDATGLEVAKGSMRGLSMDLGGPLGDKSYGELKLYDTEGQEFAVFNQDGILCKSGDMRVGYKGILITDLQYGQDWSTYNTNGHSWMQLDSDEITLHHNISGTDRYGGINLTSDGYLKIDISHTSGLLVNNKSVVGSGKYVKSASWDSDSFVNDLGYNTVTIDNVCTDLEMDSSGTSWVNRQLIFVDRIDWNFGTANTNLSIVEGNVYNGFINT